MSGRGRLVVAVLIGALLGAVPVPATAVPAALGLDITPEGYGRPVDQPFLAERFFAESDAIPGVSGASDWVCHVDFGDGATGGYWRAQDYASAAPCAAIHSYAEPGTYELVMTVTDTEGNTVSENRQVTVVARPVVATDAGVEGKSIELAGPATEDEARWSFARDAVNDICEIGRKPAAAMVVTCHDDGTFRVNYDTGTAATSGGYDVTYENGAPRPTMRATRVVVRPGDQNPHYVRVRRVGTGDQVRFDVNAHDPSTYRTSGDEIRCVYNHGNGLREVQQAYLVKGTCNGQTSYLAPGRRTSRVRVTDKDGAAATAHASVMVVRRDVHLAVRDIKRGGIRGVIAASLTPRGLRGRVALRFPNGQSLVATRLISIQVTSVGSVSLLGRAKVDGRTGYRFVVFPESRYVQGIAFSAYAWPVGKPSEYVVNQTAYRNQFRVRLHAPPVR